jgi:anti-anti-sigma factor
MLARRETGRLRLRAGYARDVDVVGEVHSEEGTGGVRIVVLTGEHDLGTVPMVRDAFEAATGNGEALVIDISRTTFVDSSILGAVLEARRLAVEADRGFAVACEDAAEPVRRVLEVTGLAEELPVHTSREAALQALADAPT